MLPQKARRATIRLGDIPLDVYQMPDGRYELYATGVTEAVDKSRGSLSEFLEGKSRPERRRRFVPNSTLYWG